MNFIKNNNQPRNENQDASLQEVEARLYRAQNTSIPDSTFFRQKLKANLLEKRRAQETSMNPISKFFKNRGSSGKRTLLAALALVLIVAIVLPLLNRQGGGGNIFVSPVYAQDNFEVIPTAGDALAVESNTHFIIKSKVAIDTADLKKSLKISPPRPELGTKADVPFKINKKSDHEFEVIPEKSLKEREVYNLKIDYAYVNEQNVTVERDYSFAFQVKNQLKVIKTLPGKDTARVPLDSGIEVTFSSENVSQFDATFVIEPAVQGRFEKHNRTWVFVPNNLAPKQLYTVTIKKEIKVDGANPMPEDYVFQFETEEAGKDDDTTDQRSWAISDNFSFFEFGSKQTVVLPLWSRQKEGQEFTVSAYKFPSQKEFLDHVKQKDATPRWTVYRQEREKVNTAQLQKVNDYKLIPQEYSYNRYLVLPENMVSGYYVLEVQSGEGSSQVLVEISNLTTFIEVTETQTLVWVNNLLTQKPQAGAVVQNMSSGASGTTNESGVVQFETAAFFTQRDQSLVTQPYYVQVKNGNDSVLMRAYNHSQYSYYDNRGSATDKYWKYISLDRGTYKTTDNIKFWGFVKPRIGSLEKKDVTVALLAPSGWFWYSETEDENYLQKAVFTINNDGMFEGEMKLQNITPGYYTMVFKQGEEILENRYIEIQTYVKPAYTLTTTASKKAVFVGEPVKFTTKAAFFEGTPVSQLEINYSGTQSGNLATNEQGEASINLKIEPSPCTFGSGCGERSLSFHSRPARAEDGEITQYQSAQVYSSRVETQLELLEVNTTTVHVSTTVYARDLSYLNNDIYEDDYLSAAIIAPGKKLKGRVTEISYTKKETGEYYDFINKKKVKTYSYDRVEKIYQNFEGVADDQGRYSFDFVIDPEKSYQVELLTEDGFGLQDYTSRYYYTRKGYERGQNSTYTWYSLRLPENRFAGFSIGEPVTLQAYQNENKLTNPTGPILYYTLKDGLQKFSLAYSGAYSFVFGDEDVPNVYVGAIYFDGKTYNKITQDGLLNVTFRSEDKKLDVDVQTNKVEYKPGEQATLTVSAKDKNGNGRPTTVHVSIIDEAYFAVGSSGAGDPLYGLYSSVASGEKFSYHTHNYSRLDRFGGAEKGCFLSGTKITMANGSVKNIEDVKVGDEILTFKDAVSGEKVKGKVLKLQNHMVGEYLVINDELRVTPEHRLLVNGQWRMAGSTKVGDILRDENNRPVLITSLQRKYSIVKVYNFTVEEFHTYIADGIWVHNDKGDGAARMDFPDVAVYQSVKTDGSGVATFSVKLPDNITSWRVTAEAVSTDLYGGLFTKNFNVSLPFFATTNFAPELLAGDAPLLTVRGFGKGVRSGEIMQGTVRAPFLPQGQAAFSGKVFEAVRVNLPSLNTGEYAVTTTLSAKQMKDTLVQKISVAPTRLTRAVAVPVTGENIPGGKIGITKFVITDVGRGKYYPDVITLKCGCGDRIDQKVGRMAADRILEQYFGQKVKEETLKLSDFQESKGGIRLLPYASADEELSAKMAALIPDAFDTTRLAQYFYEFLADGQESNREEVVLALYGLSSLHEPVLPSVRSLTQIPDLTPKEKIYMALSFAELGDLEQARKMYRELLNQYGDNLNSESMRVKIGANQDEIVESTALMAALGAHVNEAGADKLYFYAVNTPKKDILINIERLLFLENIIPTLPVADGEVTVSIAGKTQVVKVKNGSSEEVWSAPQSLSSVKFSNIKGPIQILSVYDVPLTESSVKPVSEIYVERKYFVKGQEVQLVHEGEVVEVRIYPKVNSRALSGDYEVVDVLPAGLRSISNNNYRAEEYSKCTTRYPFEVNGQIVKFLVWNGSAYSCRKDYFSYYARVTSLGVFKTDHVLIQSINHPDYLNYSGAGKHLTIQQ